MAGNAMNIIFDIMRFKDFFLAGVPFEIGFVSALIGFVFGFIGFELGLFFWPD
jgi:hypothetical protein